MDSELTEVTSPCRDCEHLDCNRLCYWLRLSTPTRCPKGVLYTPGPSLDTPTAIAAEARHVQADLDRLTARALRRKPVRYTATDQEWRNKLQARMDELTAMEMRMEG